MATQSEEPNLVDATEDAAVPDVDGLLESRDLIGLGAAADTKRRQKHGDRVTFVRVQEVPVSHAGTDIEVLAGAGELRIVGEPETSRAAVVVTEGLAAGSGAIPVTGFLLDGLATLCRHETDALRDLLGELRGAGLAMVSGLRADSARAREWLAVSQDAGLDVGTVVVEQCEADGGIDLLREVAAWGNLASHVHAFSPLARAVASAATTGYGDVRRVALARLLVDNIDSIQVDWSRYGPKLAQVALTFGADDVDAVSPVDSRDEGPRRTPLEEIKQNIRAAAMVPIQRNGCFGDL